MLQLFVNKVKIECCVHIAIINIYPKTRKFNIACTFWVKLKIYAVKNWRPGQGGVVCGGVPCFLELFRTNVRRQRRRYLSLPEAKFRHVPPV